jgi:hypothetical protein
MGSPSRYVRFQSFSYKSTYDMSQILLSPYLSTDYRRPDIMSMKFLHNTKCKQQILCMTSSFCENRFKFDVYELRTIVRAHL